MTGWSYLTNFKLTESMTWFTKIKPRRPNTEKELTTLANHIQNGPRWDSMRNNGWPEHDAEDRSELHTLQSRAKCVRSRDLRRCRLSQFSCACLNPCLGLVQGRLPKCISSHCPMAPDNKPAQSTSDHNPATKSLRITKAPRANISFKKTL